MTQDEPGSFFTRWQAALETERAEYAAADLTPVELAILDVLAPIDEKDSLPNRYPAFEFAHETTPSAAEMIELVRDIARAVAAATTSR
jgi:hypothetical protein